MTTDTLAAEAKRLAGEHRRACLTADRHTTPANLDAVVSTAIAMESAIDAIAADAARYQFLRNAQRAGRNGGRKWGRGFDVMLWDGSEGDILRGAELDAAIDRSMATSQQARGT